MVNDSRIFHYKANIWVSIICSTWIGHNIIINSINFYHIEKCIRKQWKKITLKTVCVYIIQELLLLVSLSNILLYCLYFPQNPKPFADLGPSFSSVSTPKTHVACSPQSITKNEDSHRHLCYCAHILHVNLFIH